MKNEQQVRAQLCNAVAATYPSEAAKDANWEFESHLRDNSRALQWIADFFADDEVPAVVLFCRTPDIRYKNDSQNTVPPTGWLILTNRRLLYVCANGGGLFSAPEPIMLQFSFGSLTGLRTVTKGTVFKTTWLLLYVATTSARGDVAQVSFEVDSYHPSHLKDHIVNAFVADLQSCIRNMNKPAVNSLQSNPADAANTDDVLGTLERLSTLRQQGMLTDKEFAAAKRKLLGL